MLLGAIRCKIIQLPHALSCDAHEFHVADAHCSIAFVLAIKRVALDRLAGESRYEAAALGRQNGIPVEFL